MSLRDILSPFSVWKRSAEKPYTVKDPVNDRPGAPRYRGFHKNDHELCIGCGTCHDICQNAAIDMVEVEGVESEQGDSGLRPKIDYGRCCWCALCVDICPTGSLSMSNEYIWVDTDPEVFRFVPGAEDKWWDSYEEGYRRHEEYRLLNPEREEMGELAPAERSASFMEMVRGYSAEQARAEADRCIQCGICTAICPAHMDIPGYIKAIREENISAGLELMYETNPFPATCGRVCTHRCEEVCALGHTGDPIAIRWLKRYLADQAEAQDYKAIAETAEEERPQHAAIIGAGPGGLTAAYYLRLLGYKVTVFEGKEKAGGMLRYGIPEYRLPYDRLDQDIDFIASLGVEIVYGTRIGRDKGFEELLEQYDALFFSTGLPEPYQMGIEGEEHPRVIPGLEILERVTRGERPELGTRVAVVGGGNAAMDAARTARRLGCEVTVLYRRREVDMPADQEEIDEAKEEGVNIVPQAIPVRVEDRDGRAAFIWGEAAMQDQGPGKRPKPILQEDKIHTQEYDTIVPAIGQGTGYTFLPEEYSDRIGIVRYQVQTGVHGETGEARIFAGGDIANKTKDAISAIADGHRAAIGMDRAMRKEGS